MLCLKKRALGYQGVSPLMNVFDQENLTKKNPGIFWNLPANQHRQSDQI